MTPMQPTHGPNPQRPGGPEDDAPSLTFPAPPVSNDDLLRIASTTQDGPTRVFTTVWLSQRFPDGFIVYSTDRARYVESIDTYDGSTEYTADPRMARIFRGSEWAEVWARTGFTLHAPPTPGES